MNNKLNIKNEIIRKVIHMGGLIMPISYIFFESKFHYSFLCVFLSVVLILIEISKKNNLKVWIFLNCLFNDYIRSYEKKGILGSTYMIVSFTIISIVFPKYIAIPAMIISVSSDAVAAIWGLRYGMIKTFNNKTLEGSLAFTFVTVFILFFTLNLTLTLIILISIVIALIESLSPMKYDNLTLPLSSALLLFLLV